MKRFEKPPALKVQHSREDEFMCDNGPVVANDYAAKCTRNYGIEHQSTRR